MHHSERFGRWFGLAIISYAVAVQSATPPVVINEIHYNPDVKTDWAEFIELYNTGTNTINISDWRLSDAVEFTLPSGTSLGPNSYLVIAQDPPTILKKFGVNALGPWTGSLNNSGDHIVLLNAAGGIEDEVEYQSGFPWPTVGDAPGYSIELANPNFDNSLGGNWRASVVGNPSQQSQTLLADHSSWRYFKGLSEASSPTTAWRDPGFDDSSWPVGAAPIGYDPAVVFGTPLDDMRGNYTSFFVRTAFWVDNPNMISSLTLQALYDDGFKLWINGVNLLNQSLDSGEVPYNATANGTARESNNYDTFILDNPPAYLRPGTNVIAVQVHNILLSESSDCFWDARLLAITGPSGHGPTPGRVNSAYATNMPPQIRQVEHAPEQPTSGETVLVSAKVTDPEGVASVTLEYQVVDPGNYIAVTDPAFTNSWSSVPMNDVGQAGDAHAGDTVYTAQLPGSLQQHRRLIRYRITAVDGAGLSIRVPYTDDPQPNFAYFCYDGVPAWQAAVQPGVTTALSFSTNVMRRLPVVQLLSKQADVENATWFSRYDGDAYPWVGTLVFDGKVYDHIHYRARGGVWRYAMVKNMWKFDLNRGHELEMRDDYGDKYKTKWTKLNIGACIQQGDYNHRGEQGMFESVGFRLFNLAGNEACNTTYVQLRIIDGTEEAPAGTQYGGDFWGLYLAVEQEDGRFLDEHELPDGNFYKMDGGTGELNNLGPYGPTDKSDLNAFLIYNSTTPSDAWWRTNLDLSRYYSYRAIVEAIHQYDIDQGAGKNYFYYLNPENHIWSVHSWDLDLTWANNMYGGGDEPFRDRVLPRAAFNIDYRNRVREIRDLLYNNEQTGRLIDECAWLLRGPTNGPTFLDADRCQWDFNPKMADANYSSAPSKSGQGRFYQWPNEPSVSKNFNGCIQLMKNYVVYRSGILDSLSADPSIPAQPSLAFIGATNYSINQLTFRSSDYSGANPFAAMKWRVAEITDPASPFSDPPSRVHYEITPAWESGELTSFSSDVTLPSSAFRVGDAYRVRVRMKDSTGRWSHWSPPLQFVAGLPDNASAVVENLHVTELMYDPPAGSDYEFVELHNASDTLTLDLSGVKFTEGIDFTFSSGTTLAPNAYLLVIKAADPAAFRAYYGLAASAQLCGPYSGSLANEGEDLHLKVGAGGTEIFSFKFGAGRGWPAAAKGAGHSLVPLEMALPGQATGALDYPGNWRASAFIGGSPGSPDPAPPAPAVLLNEVAAHTDYSDPAHPEYDSNDWLELFNSTSAALNLDGYFLSDDPANPRKWAVPALTIPAYGWLSFDEVTGFHNPITSGFGLDKAGEAVLLSHLAGDAPDRVVDAIEFKGQENGVSLGRFPDGSPRWFQMPRTRDTANGAGLPGVVVNELMYHPPDFGTNDNTRDEYIELLNPTANAISLQDTNGTWRLDGGIGFVFPANTTIPAGGTLLVVNFDPSDTAALQIFQGVFGITNQSLQILGAYSGKLGNRSDRVALEKPQYPDRVGAAYSWIIVDEVIYGNQNPWPVSANGGGNVLQRVSSSASGDDPANWVASTPTPGQAGGEVADTDGDGMPDAWERQYHLNPADPRDATLDPDGDGMSNLTEFLAGTNPRDASSALRLNVSFSASGAVTLRFTAAAQHSYTIQYRPDVAAGTWQKLADIQSEAADHAVEIPDPAPNGSTQRFYRLVTPTVP